AERGFQTGTDAQALATARGVLTTALAEADPLERPSHALSA
ncbi:MAG: hypothetical protein JWN27_1667, partial [Candidatus Eremiobacteraeota bacterium]|nr:hypothetical protein [Candidatus Eremiobacteraeota bacterium]